MFDWLDQRSLQSWQILMLHWFLVHYLYCLLLILLLFIFVLFLFLFFYLIFVCTIFHVPGCSFTFSLAKLYVAGIDCYVDLHYNVRGMCKCCVQPAYLFENFNIYIKFPTALLELFRRYFCSINDIICLINVPRFYLGQAGPRMWRAWTGRVLVKKVEFRSENPSLKILKTGHCKSRLRIITCTGM